MYSSFSSLQRSHVIHLHRHHTGFAQTYTGTGCTGTRSCVRFVTASCVYMYVLALSMLAFSNNKNSLQLAHGSCALSRRQLPLSLVVRTWVQDPTSPSSSSAMKDSEEIEGSTLSIYIPVSIDGTRLVWDGNPATIPGMMYETERHFTRKGLFQPLLAHRAVALSNGRLAVEAASAWYFTSGAVSDPHTFGDPCPPTATRLKKYNEEVSAGTRGGGLAALLTALTEVPEAHRTDTIVAEHLVIAELAKLQTSLTHVFGNAPSSEAIIDVANGDGIAFIGELLALAKEAELRDRAIGR